ncbi:MAG: AAA family ATPase [Planctomycetales bacterium]
MNSLTPVQRTAFLGIRHALSLNPVALLWGESGCGKTMVLQELEREFGARLLTMKDLLEAMKSRHPLALEETFEQIVIDALQQSDCVIIDDVDVLESVVGGCRSYPRSNWLDAVALTLCRYVVETTKKLVFGGGGPSAIYNRGYRFGIEQFGLEDYQQLIATYLPPPQVERLNIEKIYRYAPGLDGHQIRNACRWLAEESSLDTDRFIEYLRSQGMTSNVHLSDVRQVALQDLEGIDHVIESLETHIVFPMENDDMSRRYGLKPKRGVLLLGPPGTGKTTIGRALAHRLKSKFFLIDGTFIAGTDHFYYRVDRVFEEAQRNAPAVIFIDDCDAIFQSGSELGLYRYLLTKLDGLESQSMGRVCVMFTAMDVADLPPALVRSGRIELWLETKLPDASARHSILSRHLRGLPEEVGTVDVQQLVEATAGFTGADLGPVIDDGKNLLAYDQFQKRERKPSTSYFLAAIQAIRSNKERYALVTDPASVEVPALSGA